MAPIGKLLDIVQMSQKDLVVAALLAKPFESKESFDYFWPCLHVLTGEVTRQNNRISGQIISLLATLSILMNTQSAICLCKKWSGSFMGRTCKRHKHLSSKGLSETDRWNKKVTIDYFQCKLLANQYSQSSPIWQNGLYQLAKEFYVQWWILKSICFYH